MMSLRWRRTVLPPGRSTRRAGPAGRRWRDGGGAGRCGESAVVGAVVVLAFVLLPVLLAALAVTPLAGAGQRPGPGRSDRRSATTAPGNEAEAAASGGKDGAAVGDL
jgi:hypothetical protein